MITNLLPTALFVGVVMALTGMLTGGLAPTVRAVTPPEQCPCGKGFIGPGHQCGGAR